MTKAGTNPPYEQLYWCGNLADFRNNIKYQTVASRREDAFLRFWPRRQPGEGQTGQSRTRPLLVLSIMVLLPWIALGTVLLSEIDYGARSAVDVQARMRASASAALLDQRFRTLLQSIERSQATAGRDDREQLVSTTDPSASNSISVQTKEFEGGLTVVTPVAVEGASASELGEKALIAAKSVLATKTPRVMSSIDDAGLRGLDLWLPFSKDGQDLVLLQSRMPEFAFRDSMKNMSPDASWDMAVIDPDGTVLARDAADEPQTAALQSASIRLISDFSPDGSYAVGTSYLSPFGFRVRAMTPLAPLEDQSRRNWTGFFIVTCFLTAISLAADRAMFLRRASMNSDGQPELSLSTRPLARVFSVDNEHTSQAGSYSPGVKLDPVRRLDEARLHQALVAGGICIWEWRRPNNTIVWENSPAALLRQASDMPPPTVRALIRRTFPQERRRMLHAIRIALADGRPLSIDIRLTCFDGEQRWIAVRANPIRSEAGLVLGFVGTANDVTDQKRGLSRTDALLREVSHRSKNMLALIFAMARLTARDAVDVKSHLKEFALRVAGLSASQDLIVAADWQSVDFARLASAEIEAVARSDASRVKISGPPLLVTPEAAQTLGMILTELALNATAHGALSVASGEVMLQWAFPNASTIKISWREIGGPTYDADRSKGYSLSVIERFSSQGLKLDFRITSDHDGMTWTLEGPLAHIGMHLKPFPA